MEWFIIKYLHHFDFNQLYFQNIFTELLFREHTFVNCENLISINMV